MIVRKTAISSHETNGTSATDHAHHHRPPSSHLTHPSHFCPPVTPNRKPRMKPSRSQKETPGLLNRKRPRKGSRGQRTGSYPACLTDQSANSAYRIDETATHCPISSSKPAGPLSRDTRSLGGSFFAARMQTKRNPGSWHRRKGREKDTRGQHGETSTNVDPRARMNPLFFNNNPTHTQP